MTTKEYDYCKRNEKKQMWLCVCVCVCVCVFVFVRLFVCANLAFAILPVQSRFLLLIIFLREREAKKEYISRRKKWSNGEKKAKGQTRIEGGKKKKTKPKKKKKTQQGN